jgi:ribosomal protein S12 methylthiotransferase
MAQGKVLPYLDIPFQHGSPRLLKLMRRPAAAENTLARIRTWREICPDLTLRSTFIVGFPGETEADFQTLLDFLDEAQLDRVGAFEYSPVTGAAANELPDPVPEEVKAERHARFMEKQQAISRERLKARIGHEVDVLVDHAEPGLVVARSAAEAPEIDGVIYVKGARKPQPGQRLSVRITGSDDHDLQARAVSARSRTGAATA